jgi:hypothetical protein
VVGVGGWLVVVGAAVFFAGAAYGVPQVFTLRSPEERLAVLRARAQAWRVAQWPYAGGPLLAALGVVALAAGWSGQARVLGGVAGVAMLVGAVLWSVSCARRGRRVEEFARGELPAGAWLGYVWLTLVGLTALGLASLGLATWVGVMLLIATAAFTALFLITRDIPPFLFYLALAVVGVWALLANPQ